MSVDLNGSEMSIKKMFKVKKRYPNIHSERWKLTMQWNSIWLKKKKKSLTYSVDEIKYRKIGTVMLYWWEHKEM